MSSTSKKSMWADFTFPPLNLYNVPPSKYMQELHGKWLAEEASHLFTTTIGNETIMKPTSNLDDLRNKPLSELSAQDIKSRLHLINDEINRVREEYQELEDMHDALALELEKRKLQSEQQEAEK